MPLGRRITIALLVGWLGAGAAGPAHAQTDLGASAAQSIEPLEEEQTLPPFGSNLFTGAFSAERDDGLSGGYKIVPGDRITVRLWGAATVDQTATVDAQGNIFVPEVGPIHVEGVRNDQLDDVVGARVRATYVENVEVYTNLHGTQPVAVFVTGGVASPGMYAGVATDTVLYYLDRAGGIDPERGSYRDISVLRDDRLLQRVDLYPFLLEGRLPAIQLKDGDTIVVGARGTAIAVEGLTRTPASFEFESPQVRGAELLRLARPKPEASHAAIEGERDDGPFSLYVTLDEFAELTLRDGDAVRLERGRPLETLLVRIEGEHLGPSAMAVPVGTSLHEVLDRVRVNPEIANTDAIYLRRTSVKKRQREALEESLHRLEASVLGAQNRSEGEVEIRVREAELIAKFVERARQIEPEGRLIVSRNDETADLRLEPDDVVVIPGRTDVVMVHGEVNFPRAVVHRPGASISAYIDQAGGFTARADDDRIVLRRANGEIEIGSNMPVRPGDEVHVLPEVDVKSLQIVKDVLQVIYQLALSSAVILAL